MDQFVVSARKYRPSAFDLVVGQEHITTTLKNAIANNHLAHAFLFCGPRGVGKTTCARILAKTINCMDLQPGVEPCNKCDSCLAFNKNASFNVHELDAASNNSVDDIRSLVEQVRYPPQQGKYKVYIIDEVHMLSQSAFNAFLKTLEEPPSYAKFILATTEKHKILPTILSRCQIFDFNRIAIDHITSHLQKIASLEEIEAEPEALEVIARKADGGLRDALSMFDLLATFGGGKSVTYQSAIKNLHILDYDYYFKVVDYIMAENLPDTLIIFDEILSKGFDGHNFLTGLSEHMRNLLVCKDTATIQLLQATDAIKAKYAQQAKQLSMSLIVTGLNILSQADINYKTSKNNRLLVEMALIKLCYAGAAVKLASGTLPEAEKKNSSPTISQPAAQPETANHVAEPPQVIQPASQMGGQLSQQPASQPAAAPRPSLGISKGFGIKDKLFNQTKDVSDTLVAPLAQKVYATRTLSDNEVASAWEQLAKHLTERNEVSKSALVKRFKPTLLNGSAMGITVTSNLEAGKMNEVIDEFRPYLLEQLNSTFQCTVHVDPNLKSSEKVLPYTAKDKFNYLLEQSPALQQLTKQLGLEPLF